MYYKDYFPKNTNLKDDFVFVLEKKEVDNIKQEIFDSLNCKVLNLYLLTYINSQRIISI